MPTLDDILSNGTMSSALEGYLSGQSQQETDSYRFLLDEKRYRAHPSAATAEALLESYVNDGAQHPINIDAPTRLAVQNSVHGGGANSDAFSAARSEVRAQVDTVLPDFFRSPFGSSFADTASQQRQQSAGTADDRNAGQAGTGEGQHNSGQPSDRVAPADPLPPAHIAPEPPHEARPGER